MTEEPVASAVVGASPLEHPALRIKPTFQSTLLVIAAVGAAFVLANVFVSARRTLGWVFATAVVAWIVWAIIAAMERHMNRSVAVVIAIVGLASLGIGTWVGIGASVGTELQRVRRALPPAAQELEEQSVMAREFRLSERVDILVNELDKRFGPMANVSTAAGTAPTYLITGILLLFFLAYGPRYLTSGLAQIADPVRRETIASTAAEASDRARMYLLITLLQTVIAVLVAAVGFTALGLPAPFGLGLMVGVVGVIPLLGLVLGGLPALLLAAVDSNDLALVGVLGILAVLQLAEVRLVRRRLDPGTVRVGPAPALIVAMIGFQVYGLGGAVYGFAALVLTLALVDARALAMDQTR